MTASRFEYLMLKAIAFYTLEELKAFVTVCKIKGIDTEKEYLIDSLPTWTLSETFKVLPETPCILYYYRQKSHRKGNVNFLQWIDTLTVEALSNYVTVSLTAYKRNGNLPLIEMHTMNSGTKDLNPLKRRLIDTYTADQMADTVPPADIMARNMINKLDQVYHNGVLVRDILHYEREKIKWQNITA